MCKFGKRCDILEIVLFLWIVVQGSRAQGEDISCYGPGSIATSVIVTIIVTLLLLYVLYLIWKRYWLKRKGKHLVLETDPEKGKQEYAYDNAGFKDVSSTPSEKVPEKTAKLDTTKSKWSQWSPFGVLTAKNEKQKTVDDSALQTDQIKIVSLKSHDFTGLGFNVDGNMRDGIFIKDILHRGPASESGKLNPGDRIKSVTINFEHIVYEDALTILSYASPYEVILEAQTGKISNLNQAPIKATQLGHPLYRSSSTTDLIQIQKTTKKRLFPTSTASTLSSPYSSLQKPTTFERNRSKSPTQHSSPQLQQQHLKTQLEQKIFHNHKQQLKTKDDEGPRRQESGEAVPQKTENKYQRFGIKVLPVDLKTDQSASPKSAELSQNDNNINLERRHIDKLKASTLDAEITRGVDEVDKLRKAVAPPPIKKREKKEDDVVQEDVAVKTEILIRRNGSTNGSGIKRDKDGIPQEIPAHMLNAAVMARRNRKGSEIVPITVEEIKSPKKQKGRAPAPPDDKIKINGSQDCELKSAALDEIDGKSESTRKTDYASDSDADETDNLSSVNTIELNASDITIHQAEDNEEIQNRRTASTGDLTKIQKTRKTSTGTLERAQSLDITDTTMPPLSKKRKGGSIEEHFDSNSGSNESLNLHGKTLAHKEPRLSLALDGLNTFQRSRLKKSTEWGNLEDAILNLNDDANRQVNGSDSESQFDALVNKINEIKQESDELHSTVDEGATEAIMTSHSTQLTNNVVLEPSPTESACELQEQSDVSVSGPSQLIWRRNAKNSENQTTINFVINSPDPVPINDMEETIEKQPLSLVVNSAVASENFLLTERHACSADPFYNSTNKMYDTNVPDDIKVSRHSLGSLESDNFKTPTAYDGNVSNIMIGDDRRLGSTNVNTDADNENSCDMALTSPPPPPPSPPEKELEIEELYTTALNTSLGENFQNETNNGSFGYETTGVIKSPETFHDINDTITVEGPQSLTFEINEDDSDRNSMKPLISNKSFQISAPPTTTIDTYQERHSPKSNFSLTYITEIQVLTPNNTVDVSETPSPTEINGKLDVEEVRSLTTSPPNEKIDPQKELHKIRELAEEQLKKLPEMRFSTSSYETSAKLSQNCSPQIEQLRSNFEKSPSKSRIPVATSSKTPPTSPERRDSRNFDLEVDKEIVAIMSSPVHSTPISSSLKYQPKTGSKNVSITSIRSNSKIPSGFPNRPPVPPRRYENSDGEGSSRLSTTNGSVDSSFKQWVFNPNDNTVTNLTVTTENKIDQK